MFGFIDVASFVHEFETAFDSVRKGTRRPRPNWSPSRSTPRTTSPADRGRAPATASEGEDDRRGAARRDRRPLPRAACRRADAPSGSLRRTAVGTAPRRPACGASSSACRPTACSTAPIRCSCSTRFAQIGPCTVTALTDTRAADRRDRSRPDAISAGRSISRPTIRAAALDDVFLFLIDEMELVGRRPLEAGARPDGQVRRTRRREPEAKATEVRAAHRSQRRTGRGQPPGRPRHAPRPRTRPVAAEEAQPAAQKEAAGGMSLRVPAERLDELMDRVGELVIAQSRLRRSRSDSSDAGLKTIAEELERLSSGLRDTTMGIRMVPIGTLFRRFRRLVHDLSRDLGKDIEFVTTGEETELDKTMIERLADPLVHLIRNAVDHGVESAETRSARRQAGQGHGAARSRLCRRRGGDLGLRRRRRPRCRRASAPRPKKPGFLAAGCQDRRPGPLPDDLRARLLDGQGSHVALGPRRRHGRGQAHHRRPARQHRAVAAHPGAGHHRDAAPAADPCHHRRHAGPGRHRPLHHPALGGRGMRRAAGRGREPIRAVATSSTSAATSCRS